ncbi:hypothetical protein HF1_13790 [Mycoplasma haemofelis str. Langford 1]|uniref:Uncharacterized protein n=1 Tax=Mycoplasma haemofelis (strain Langford 1) TaxID=941640 RepID=E8ZJR6_MYCHL|nr:hypothetical protein [Mycoplasma haemofelis]CBY93387.1 hypothetical protein HF1_13790 [Mycoplasma haemofelis str. Langford 1]
MDLLYKIAISLGLVGTGGAGAFYGIKRFGTTRVKHKLGNRLLSTKGNENKAQWESRLDSLKKSSSSHLTAELQALKNTAQNKTWQDLRDVCSQRIEEPFQEEDSKFKEVVDYCTFRNKDKLGSGVINEALESSGTLKSGGKWNKVSEALKSRETGVSSTMKGIQDKLKASSNPETTALKTWCEGASETPWINDEDPSFKDAQQHCLDNS